MKRPPCLTPFTKIEFKSDVLIPLPQIGLLPTRISGNKEFNIKFAGSLLAAAKATPNVSKKCTLAF